MERLGDALKGLQPEVANSKKKHAAWPSRNGFVTFVRGWIAFVGMMALANTAQCFVSPDFVWTKLYNAPGSGATTLAARTYGMWTFLAAAIRFLYTYNIYNWELFLATILTFFTAFAHFLSELLYFGSGLADVGMISPIIISGTSVLLMVFAIPYIWPSASMEEDFDDVKNLSIMKKSAKLKDKSA